MRELLCRALGCDVRSLAAFRIALGLLLLADLSGRLPFFSLGLTEAGAWPIAAAQATKPWSLYFLSESPAWTVALLATAGIAAIALLAGFKTRAATILSWVLLVSLQARNHLPLNAGDTVLALLLFWGMFLPLGACWSVDARRNGARSGQVLSVGSGALLLQIALIYVFNALYKSGVTWKDGSAIALALQEETYVTALGSILRGWPSLLSVTTHATWWLELLGPLVALLPFRNGVHRGLIAFAFIGFHIGLFATLRLGLFPLICVVAWLPFLPGGFWNIVGPRLNAPPIAPSRRFAQVLPAIALVMVLAVNVLGYAGVKSVPWLSTSAKYLHLQQKWSLFAPNPNRSQGWFVVVLETADGLEHDALTGSEVNWARPAHLRDAYASAWWRKYLASMKSTTQPERVRQFAAWCWRNWEATHPGQKVTRVRVHYLWEWLAKRQDPPDHWFIYENPPGPLSEMAKEAGYPVAPADSQDL